MSCEDNCPICFESLEDVTVCTTKCNHKYCAPCFIRHMSNPKSNGSCPLCRNDLMDESLLEALEYVSSVNENKKKQSNISFDDVTLLLSMNEMNNDHTSVVDLFNSQVEYHQYIEEEEEYELEEGEILEESTQETINPPSDPTTNLFISGNEVTPNRLDFICDLTEIYSEIDRIDLTATAHEISDLSMDIAELSMSNIELDETTETVTYTIDRNPTHPPFELISAIESPNFTSETLILDHLPETVTVRH